MSEKKLFILLLLAGFWAKQVGLIPRFLAMRVVYVGSGSMTAACSGKLLATAFPTMKD